MKHIHNLKDLQQYGVNLLTGEADRLSFRILCDLNEAGTHLISDYLGLPYGVALNKNWNSQVGGTPAVASVMLSVETLWELARFALMTVGNYDVVVKNVSDGLVGLYYDEKYATHYIETANETGGCVYRNHAKSSTAPGSGSRNEHMATGRVDWNS